MRIKSFWGRGRVLNRWSVRGSPMNAIDVAGGYKKMLEMRGHFVGPTRTIGQDGAVQTPYGAGYTLLK